MLVLLVFAVWFSPGAPDLVRAQAVPSVAVCQEAKAKLVAEAAAHGHQIDVRCLELKMGQPA